MIDPRIEDLLNEEMDGQVTEEQQTALRVELHATPEVESYRDDLQELQQVLLAVKEVEPPAALRDEILFRLDQARHEKARHATQPDALTTAPIVQGGSESPGSWQGLLRGLRGAFGGIGGLQRREVFAFAAGATLGIALLFVGTNRMTSIPDSAFPGAMVPLGTMENARLVDSTALQGGDVQGHVEITRNAAFIFTSIQVQSQQPVAIEILFDSQVLAIRGITQETGDAPLQAALSAGRVEIQHQGNNTYHLTMEDRGNGVSEVRIRLNQEGQIIEKTLRTAE